MSTIHRCPLCHGMLDFYGIVAATPRRGWRRWSICHVDALYLESDGAVYYYIGKKAPPKALFGRPNIG